MSARKWAGIETAWLVAPRIIDLSRAYTEGTTIIMEQKTRIRFFYGKELSPFMGIAMNILQKSFDVSRIFIL